MIREVGGSRACGCVFCPGCPHLLQELNVVTVTYLDFFLIAMDTTTAISMTVRTTATATIMIVISFSERKT